MQTLSGVSRDKMGTRQTRRLRDQGFIPGIIYGHGEANEPFAVSAHDFAAVLQHGEHLVELELDGRKGNYLIKDVQRDAFDHNVIHVDLARVNLDETVEVTVPLVLRGTAAGEDLGGVVNPGAVEVEVECRVSDIPEEIRVDISKLQIGQTIRVRDLPAVTNGKILTDKDTIIASCQLVAEEAEAPTAEEGAAAATQPEVIKRGKEEEGEEPAK